MERVPPIPEGAVLCRSTGHGAGCGHPTTWHVGPSTPAPDCDCCSWRRNAAQPGRWVAGPLGLPMIKEER